MSDVSTYLFTISTLALCGLLVFKMWTFFNFSKYTFWENILREGVYLISSTIAFTYSFIIAMLNIKDHQYVFISIHEFNVAIYSLVWIICIASALMSFKQLSKRDKAQGE